eukprot:1343204-Amphidinium_carterae.1
MASIIGSRTMTSSRRVSVCSDLLKVVPLLLLRKGVDPGDPAGGQMPTTAAWHRNLQETGANLSNSTPTLASTCDGQ